MKKVVTILVSTVISLAAMSQTKKTYTLNSFPTYDQYGNYYEVTKEYDHLPTAQDSTSFELESRIHINRMIDSTESNYRAIYNKSNQSNLKPKKNGKTNRYTKRSSR